MRKNDGRLKIVLIVVLILFTATLSVFTIWVVSKSFSDSNTDLPIEHATPLDLVIPTEEPLKTESSTENLAQEPIETEVPTEILTEKPLEIPYAKKNKPLNEVFSFKGLVDLEEIEPNFTIDLKYATEDNFTGVVHYKMQLPLLQKKAAERLLAAQKIFREDGYSLIIYDVYRPLKIQQALYDFTPANLKMFVAKPNNNAKHSKGMAVDCGLTDLEGNIIPMPSAFDEFNESAYADYTGGTEEQRKNRDYLINVMEECGFSVYSKEWWHFIAPEEDCETAIALDIDFEDFVVLRDEFYKNR